MCVCVCVCVFVYFIHIRSNDTFTNRKSLVIHLKFNFKAKRLIILRDSMRSINLSGYNYEYYVLYL